MSAAGCMSIQFSLSFLRAALKRILSVFHVPFSGGQAVAHNYCALLFFVCRLVTIKSAKAHFSASPFTFQGTKRTNCWLHVLKIESNIYCRLYPHIFVKPSVPFQSKAMSFIFMVSSIMSAPKKPIPYRKNCAQV